MCLGAHHVLGRPPPDVRERHHLVALACRSRREGEGHRNQERRPQAGGRGCRPGVGAGARPLFRVDAAEHVRDRVIRPPAPVPAIDGRDRVRARRSSSTHHRRQHPPGTGRSPRRPPPGPGKAGRFNAARPGATSAAGSGRALGLGGGRGRGYLGRGGRLSRRPGRRCLGGGRRRNESRGRGVARPGWRPPGAPAAPSEMTASSESRRRPSRPPATKISASTPPTGDGTSESTLSVLTSNSTSSSAIGSPTALAHLVMVPSGDRLSELRAW